MAEWPCCHDPLRFSPLSLRFVPPPQTQTKLILNFTSMWTEVVNSDCASHHFAIFYKYGRKHTGTRASPNHCSEAGSEAARISAPGRFRAARITAPRQPASLLEAGSETARIIAPRQPASLLEAARISARGSPHLCSRQVPRQPGSLLRGRFRASPLGKKKLSFFFFKC